MTGADTAHTENVRLMELDLVIDEMSLTDRVLEIGGGSGFQAAAISRRVAQCVSVDVRPHPEPRYPVLLYDGVTLPFEDASFDVIFSSNVLEHVTDLDVLLRECARVLKPTGTMCHIVPSPFWRIWTTLTYYPALPKVILGNVRNLVSGAHSPQPESSVSPKQSTSEIAPVGRGGSRISAALAVLKNFKLKWIRSLLLSPRHGERGNELTEVFYFRATWWRSLFERNGWTVVAEQPGQLFYSGNILFGAAIGLPTRRGLSRLMGSSTRKFTVRRSDA